MERDSPPNIWYAGLRGDMKLLGSTPVCFFIDAGAIVRQGDGVVVKFDKGAILSFKKFCWGA